MVGEVVPDLLLSGGTSALIKKGTSKVLTKKLASEGYEIASGAAATAALRDAFLIGEKQAVKNKASDLILSGAVTPLTKSGARKIDTNVINKLTDDLISISTGKTAKLTDTGRVLVSAAGPSMLRSAGSAYNSYMEALPDSLTYEEKRKIAVKGGLIRGLITGGLVGGFQYFRLGGVESIAVKRAGKLNNITGTRHRAAAYRALSNSVKATTKQGDRLLNRMVAEVAAKIGREGLRNTIARGIVKTAFKKAPKAIIPEAIEEGLDEFLGSYVDSSLLGQRKSLNERMAGFVHSAILGGMMGAGIPAGAAGLAAARRKLGFGPDESSITEANYREIVDDVISQAEELNEKAMNLEGSGAPLSAEVIKQSRDQLLAGFAKDPVAPAGAFNMSTTTNVIINGSRESNELVRVEAKDITGVTEMEADDGTSIYQVEYIPTDKSGETLLAYTSDASVKRIQVRQRSNKVNQELISRVEDISLIDDGERVVDQEEFLAQTEGVKAAVNSFAQANRVSFENNGIKVLSDATDEQLFQLGITVSEESQKYQVYSGGEYFVDINEEGVVFLIFNSKSISDITASMPKARRSKYIKSTFVEAMASSMELIAGRDKFVSLDAETRGTNNLQEFIIQERMAVYEEMTPYERDRAASLLLGKDLTKGLADEVEQKSLLAAAQLNYLIQFDQSETTTVVERTAWEGKGRGGAMSKKVQEKLFDILDYLRAATRTHQDKHRPELRAQIEAISDKLTNVWFEDFSKLTDEEIDTIIKETEPTEVEGNSGNVGAQGIEGINENVRSQENLPTTVSASTASALNLPEAKALNFNVPQVEGNVAVALNEETGETFFVENMSVADARFQIDSVKFIQFYNKNLLEPTTIKSVVTDPNINYNADANSNLVLVTSVDSNSVQINDVRTEADTPAIREAILQNPLFSRNIVEGDFDGDNVAFVFDLKNNLVFAVPKKARFHRELTPEDQQALIQEEPRGVSFARFSKPVREKMINFLLGEDAPPTPEITSETRTPEQANEAEVDVQKSSIPNADEHVEEAGEINVDVEAGDSDSATSSNNIQTKKRDRLFNKVMSSIKRSLFRAGRGYYESTSDRQIAWFDRSRKAVGINPEGIKAVLAAKGPLAGKAAIKLALNEETVHQVSYETLSYKEIKNAIQELINADSTGANALIMMAQEYNVPIKGFPVESVIAYLRMGQPAYLDLPEGVEVNEKNQSIKESLEEYLFEELLRKHVTLVSGDGASEVDYAWLKSQDNPTVLQVYKKYISNFFMGRLKAKNELAKDSALGPYFASAVHKVAMEYKAAKEGFRRKPDDSLLDDLDVDLGVYSKQQSLIGQDINTLPPEEEEREEWLSEVDPEQIKNSVVAGRTVGTRSPSAKGTEGQGVNPENQVSLNDLRTNPEAYKKNALVLINFPIVAREFAGDPLLEKVRKAKDPLNKAELKREQLKQEIAFDNKKLKNDLISFKVSERSDELKPLRKEEANEAKQSFKESTKKVEKIEKDITKLEAKLVRAKNNLKAIISREVKKVNGQIKRASATGNVEAVTNLKEQKEQIKAVLSQDSEISAAIDSLVDQIKESRVSLKNAKSNNRSLKRSLDAALSEFSKPKVARNSIKISNDQVQSIIKGLADDVSNNRPVRVGAKSLIAKQKAIAKKQAQLKKASESVTRFSNKFGERLKELSKSDRAFPIDKADAIYSSVNEVAKRNLSLLIKAFPQDLRVFASLWYDGANIIANDFAKVFGTSVEQAAAVLAVNSPQKDWYMNVALAERTMHIFKSQQSAKFDRSMAANFLAREGEPELKYDKDGNAFYEGNATPVYDDEGNHLRDENGMLQFDNWSNKAAEEKLELAVKVLNLGLKGKKLKDIKGISFDFKGKKKTYSKEELQARFVRMFSEATANESLRDVKTFNVIRPDGKILERPSLSDKGKPRSIAWGSYSTIEKSINILNAEGDQDMDVISEQLGLMHKVRSFYNNIVDPANTDGHVTMDTHAIAALLLKPVSGNSTEVTQNFGGKGTASDSVLGLSGLYPAFAEAYRSVEVENEITGGLYLAREIQSITWEAIRQLFQPKWKSNADHVRAVNDIWNEYENGVIDFAEAQENVLKFVQTSKAKGIPETEVLSTEEMIASANTNRGTGVGRPDWGNAAPVSIKESESPRQYSSIQWQTLDSKFEDLAKQNLKADDPNVDQLFSVLKRAAAQAEKRIPNKFTFAGPSVSEFGVDTEYTVIKNPTEEDLKGNEKEFLLTPANKYSFEDAFHAHAADALGLQEYLQVKETTRADGTLLVAIRRGTTAPYYLTGAGIKIVQDFYGEGTEIIFQDAATMTVDNSLISERLKVVSPVVYEGRAGQNVMALSDRLAPLTDRLKYTPVDVEDDLMEVSKKNMKDPYLDFTKRREKGSILHIPAKLETNIKDVLEKTVALKNVDTQEDNKYAEVAETLLNILSPEMLNVRVFNVPSEKRNYSSPNKGIHLSRFLKEFVPEGYENSESFTKKEKATVNEWVRQRFDSPLDAILNWQGISKALAYEDSLDASWSLQPDVSDFGEFDVLSAKQKEKLNQFVKYFSSLEIGESLNFKENPKLAKLIDWRSIEVLIRTGLFFDNEGSSYLKDRRIAIGPARSVVKGVRPKTVVHEVMHQLTQREFSKYVDDDPYQHKGSALKKIYERKSEDGSVPEPIRNLLKVYLKAIEHGDKYLYNRNGTAPTSKTKFVTRTLDNSSSPRKASENHFYGLGNIDEFVAETFSNVEFQKWLMAIPDPDAKKGEPTSLWDRFVNLITDLLNSFSLNAKSKDIKNTLLGSSINAALEVMTTAENVSPELNTAGKWKTSSGFSASIKEKNQLEKDQARYDYGSAPVNLGFESAPEPFGLHLPPVTRDILESKYNVVPEDSKNTQAANTVRTYNKIWDYLSKEVIESDAKAKYNVLDWGSGFGLGTQALKDRVNALESSSAKFTVNSYEPFFKGKDETLAPSLKNKPAANSQDFVVNNVVMNVITADERAELLQDIYKSLKEGGTAVITGRSITDVFNLKSPYQLVGPAEIITSKGTFQKGFTPDSLNTFVKEVLPDAITSHIPSSYQVNPVTIVVTKPFLSGSIKSDTADSVQSTSIGAELMDPDKQLSGKKLGKFSLYLAADAVEEGYSLLNKKSYKEKKEQFEEAKVRLEQHLQQERINDEQEGEEHVPFTYDFVVIEKDQTRFLLMSDLKSPHPFVVESKRVPNDPNKEVTDGTIRQAIYHRVESILGQRHPLYAYHKAITQREENLGLYDLTKEGKKWAPSGSLKVWNEQIKAAGVTPLYLDAEHEKIKNKFFPDNQETAIYPEDLTETPEYAEASQSWSQLMEILKADIPVMEEESRVIKYIQRKIYNKTAHPNWRKGGMFFQQFLGTQERQIKKYLERSDFFKKSIRNRVVEYKTTTDNILDEVYTKQGKDIPSQLIFDATGSLDTVPSEEVLNQIEETYLNKLTEITNNGELDTEAKKKEYLEAYNEREKEKQLARKQKIEDAKDKQVEALDKIRKDSPELAKHIISLRKLADELSKTIGDVLSITSPNVQLLIGKNLQIYLTRQYKIFTRGQDWVDEFLRADGQEALDAKQAALEYFANQIKSQKVEFLMKEKGKDRKQAEAEAEDFLTDDLKQKALREFLESYVSGNNVNSLKARTDIPKPLRQALGEFTEESNIDVLYRTILNLSNLASKLATQDHIVRIGMEAGWLVTQEKLAEETQRAEAAEQESPYEGWVEVLSSTDSSAKPDVDPSEMDPEYFKVQFDEAGVPKDATRRKLPSSNPFINYRAKSEDGSIQKYGNLLAPKAIAEELKDIITGKTEKEYKQNSFEEVLAYMTGLTLMSKTAGSIPFYGRQGLGSIIFLGQNGIPFLGNSNGLIRPSRGYVPELGSEISRLWSSKNKPASNKMLSYYAKLDTLGVLEGSVDYALLADLFKGNPRNIKEDILLEIDRLENPTTSDLVKSKLFPEGSRREKLFLNAANKLAKGTASVTDKIQTLVLALDNGMKIRAFEYERSYIEAAKEDSVATNRNDMYKDLTEAQIDTLAADIILKTQQSRSQSAPVVKFFTETPVIRILASPFARFLAENPRIMVNVPRQARAEIKSDNPLIQERGKQRQTGFFGWNFIGYIALSKLSQILFNISDEEDKNYRKGAPSWARVQNVFYFRDRDGKPMQTSMTYIHPMSPILDSFTRSLERIYRGEPMGAVKELTLGYLQATFLNPQILFSSVFDVYTNTDGTTGDKIYGEYSPDKISRSLKYIFKNGIAPPTLIAIGKSLDAMEGDVSELNEEDVRKVGGFDLDAYGPLGEIVKHLVPAKLYPIDVEQVARRRFDEISDNLRFELRQKGRLRSGGRRYSEEYKEDVVSRELEALTTGLKDARNAYLAFTNDLTEKEVANIMKDAGIRKSLISIIEDGEMTRRDFERESKGFIDALKDKDLDIRADNLKDIYERALGDRDSILLD